ncbi:MAG: flippase-like domain-containing protein [Chloroflexi bacterium]|nr:flippase-like domain-containing protein [Chloroflexota bacterium]
MTERKILRTLRVFAVYLLPGVLLYFALRNAPLTDIWKTLKQLQLWQIIVILSIDAIIYLLITARWWIIVRAGNKSVKYVPLIGVRLAVFGVSYFTLGPQVGGEPLQVLYLQRKYGLSFTRATASVIMDKLLEFLASFVLLAFGLTALLQAGIFSRNGAPLLVSLIGLVILLLWPVIHIGLMMRARHPLTAFLRAMPFVPQNAKLVRFIRAAEWMAGTFCRRHTPALLSAIFVSVLAAAAMVGEYFMLTSFLQIHLTFWQTLAAWTAGWLAFLVPLPGGLGALEASQVFALGVFGIRASSAISATLLMRARDILIGGLGLLLAGSSARRV